MKPKQTEMELGVKFVPPKLVEVIDWGYLNGLPTHECEKFHSYFQSNGWKVGRVKMVSWRDAANCWRLRWAQSSSPKHHTVFELKTIIEAKQKIADGLKRSHSSEVAGGRQWDNNDKQADFRKLYREIKELTAQLAGM